MPSFAFATDIIKTGGGGIIISGGGRGSTRKGVVGTVVSIFGNDLILRDSTDTQYGVDISSAVFDSGNSNISFDSSDILPKDLVTITGSFTEGDLGFSATKVLDMTFIQRNVFTGTVTNISGKNITFRSKTGLTYRMNPGFAQTTKGIGAQTSSFSPNNISVGDFLTVVGSISSKTVTPGFINDRTPAHPGGIIRS